MCYVPKRQRQHSKMRPAPPCLQRLPALLIDGQSSTGAVYKPNHCRLMDRHSFPSFARPSIPSQKAHLALRRKCIRTNTITRLLNSTSINNLISSTVTFLPPKSLGMSWIHRANPGRSISSSNNNAQAHNNNPTNACHLSTITPTVAPAPAVATLPLLRIPRWPLLPMSTQLVDSEG